MNLKVVGMQRWLISFILAGCCYPAGGVMAEENREVCAEIKCFQSEVVATPQGREQGLMFRERLADDQGMLFVFDSPGEYSFWMKNMLFPIDILWLDAHKRVVRLEAEVPPCTKDPCPVYFPQAEALYVLEIAVGQAAAANIQLGDQLRWN